MSRGQYLRPIVARTLSTLAGIAGLAELDTTAGLQPAELVHDRRGEQSDNRNRRLIRDPYDLRGLRQLAVPGPLGRVMAHTDYEQRRQAEMASRRAWFGRQPTKGGRDREWLASGGQAPAPAPTAPGASPGQPLGPCVGCEG